MTDFFLNIVNMSISASWIVLVVLLLRLLLKKAPKWITVLLWGIVAIRLICPFSFESVMSLIPSTETISPEIMMEHKPSINTGIPIVNDVVNPVIEESFSPEPLTSANPLQILIPVLSVVWVVGIAVMLVYTVISYLRLKSKIGTAVLLRDNIFQSESVVSPFVFGILKPRIYLPFQMNEQDMEHVIAHENAHIRRKDHWWKPFGFLVLTLHWFNPFIWLGYVLLCRDIELACDEKVVKEFDNRQKADYAQALLTCSVNRRMIAACPIAFGELGVKDRVKSVLNYKKPAFWIIVVAIIVSGVVTVCFLTDPVSEKNNTIEKSNTTEKSELLIGVLRNETKFIDEDGNEVYLKDYKILSAFNYIYPLNAVPEKYAWVDFDVDGQYELVVYAVGVSSDIGGYLVFHIENDRVFGFEFLERGMIDLKEDGTYIKSAGAGINWFCSLRFTNSTYEETELAYKNDYEKEYKLDGKKATAEEAKAFCDDYEKKKGVSWSVCESEQEELDTTESVTFRVNDTLPEYKATITYNQENPRMAETLVISEKESGVQIQKIDLPDNDCFTEDPLYVMDITFDGNLDILVPSQRPASAVYFQGYVWNAKENRFIYAPTFEGLSNVALDTENKLVLSHSSASRITSFGVNYYDIAKNDFTFENFLYIESTENNQSLHFVEEELQNGEWKTVAENFIAGDDPYSPDETNPAISHYYEKGSFWDLNSEKWESYIFVIKNVSETTVPDQLYAQFLSGEIPAYDNEEKKFLDEYFPSNYSYDDGKYYFTFLDMTGDGIEELCIKNYSLYFFSIKDNNIYHWCTEGVIYTDLLSNGALFYERAGGAPTHTSYRYYELDKNGSVSFEISFEWYDGISVEEGKVYPDQYFVDDKEVTKEEYEERTKEYLTLGSDKVVWYNGNINEAQ